MSRYMLPVDFNSLIMSKYKKNACFDQCKTLVNTISLFTYWIQTAETL